MGKTLSSLVSSFQRRNSAAGRLAILTVAALVGLLGLVSGSISAAYDGQRNGTIPEAPVDLANPSMECSSGYYQSENSSGEPIFLPNEWWLALESGGPVIHSARVFFEQRHDRNGGCETDQVHVERIEGRDSVVIRARDLETPPTPGKPFDVVLYQQVPVVPGGDYSVSGWMLSLCGGSAVPSDCPDDFYIVKALGLDPDGGTDPTGGGVVWTEDSRNFVDENDERIGWSNLRTAAKAGGDTMTVYARLNSPFQHHGNHGFIDAISLIRAPVAWLEDLPEEVRNRRDLKLTWRSLRSPDVEGVVGGTYETTVDVQMRMLPEQDWQDIAKSSPLTQQEMVFWSPCTNTTYEFRVRASAEQPPAPPDGAWPNHRYPGVWSDPQAVRFVQDIVSVAPFTGTAQVFLPHVLHSNDCP